MEYKCYLMDPAAEMSHLPGPLLFESNRLAEAGAFIYNHWLINHSDICVYQPSTNSYREFYRNEPEVAEPLGNIKLSTYSRNRLMATFKHWDIPADYADPVYNYLVFGMDPGSCFTGILANDFKAAILHSHPANSIKGFKSICCWLGEIAPAISWGSFAAVTNWLALDAKTRRMILENHHVIYTEQEEILMKLKGEPAHAEVIL